MQPLQDQPSREGRFRLIVGIVLGIIGVVSLGVCATLAYVAPYAVDFNYRTPTPDIPVTGTVTRVAGITMPADAIMLSHKPRGTGGIFEYRTSLRPQQVYNFYIATLSLQGVWTAGGSPHIFDKSAVFRFYSTYLPRLTIFNLKCDDVSCTVNVNY
jgi:hypothetical protein